MTKRKGVKPATRELSEATRLVLNDPGRAADSMELALQQIREDFPGLAHLPGVVPGETMADSLRWLEPTLMRRHASLRDGKTEAEAIRTMLDEGNIGGLRMHLRLNPVTPECVVWLLTENRRLATSLAASKAAAAKNGPARDHVANAWRGRSDRGQSKASFARAIQHDVQRRFGVRVTADRIARYWLTDE